MIKGALVKLLPNTMKITPAHIVDTTSGPKHVSMRLQIEGGIYHHKNAALIPCTFIAWGDLAKDVVKTAKEASNNGYVKVDYGVCTFLGNVYYKGGEPVIDPKTDKQLVMRQSQYIIEKLRTNFVCAQCGRKLTNEKSFKRGIGPKCWKEYEGRVHDPDKDLLYVNK